MGTLSLGRIHCFLVATKSMDVIYERFYDRLSEVEKAEVRAAFFQASSGARLNADNIDHAAAYRTARFVFIPCSDLVFFMLSSGEYDELAAAEALRVILDALTDVLGRKPSAEILLDKYIRLALVVDEVINEGILEAVDIDSIRKATKNKATWE